MEKTKSQLPTQFFSQLESLGKIWKFGGYSRYFFRKKNGRQFEGTTVGDSVASIVHYT